MPARKPKSRKRKGKNLEEKVADLIHNYASKYITEYKKITELNDRIKPHRDFSSGVFKDNPCDIELNYLLTYFPFCIECKNWSEFKRFTIFDLFKSNSKFFNTIVKIYNDYKKENLSDKNIKRLLVFKSDYTDILVLFKKDDFDSDFISLFNVIFTRENFCLVLFEDFLDKYFSQISSK